MESHDCQRLEETWLKRKWIIRLCQMSHVRKLMVSEWDYDKEKVFSYKMRDSFTWVNSKVWQQIFFLTLQRFVSLNSVISIIIIMKIIVIYQCFRAGNNACASKKPKNSPTSFLMPVYLFFVVFGFAFLRHSVCIARHQPPPPIQHSVGMQSMHSYIRT